MANDHSGAVFGSAVFGIAVGTTVTGRPPHRSVREGRPLGDEDWVSAGSISNRPCDPEAAPGFVFQRITPTKRPDPFSPIHQERRWTPGAFCTVENFACSSDSKKHQTPNLSRKYRKARRHATGRRMGEPSSEPGRSGEGLRVTLPKCHRIPRKVGWLVSFLNGKCSTGKASGGPQRASRKPPMAQAGKLTLRQPHCSRLDTGLIEDRIRRRVPKCHLIRLPCQHP